MISSFCHQGGCVDVAPGPDGTVIMSDTKTGRSLMFTVAEWEAFRLGVKAGEFDPEGDVDS